MDFTPFLLATSCNTCIYFVDLARTFRCTLGILFTANILYEIDWNIWLIQSLDIEFIMIHVWTIWKCSDLIRKWHWQANTNLISFITILFRYRKICYSINPIQISDSHLFSKIKQIYLRLWTTCKLQFSLEQWFMAFSMNIEHSPRFSKFCW